MRVWNAAGLVAVATVLGCGGGLQRSSAGMAPARLDAVLQGRQLVIDHDCGACHGGGVNPAAAGWLAGNATAEPVDGFDTHASNLTPDVTTGLGRYSERQIFNALRYGLRPSATPDVEITAAVPGRGNFPAQPSYLAPSMPWAAWRHMSDEQLHAVAAYLKRGLKPARHDVPESAAPPDAWASFANPEIIGPFPVPPYPAAQEVPLADVPAAARPRIMRGRALVMSHGCGGCHSHKIDPSAPDWLGGITEPRQEFKIGPFTTRPRNLTPDNMTGLGRFSERQIFNALRFGLRPGETPDVEITSTTPGQGNFPAHPKYLAPPMPWPAFRNLSDDDLHAIVAYLKHGVRPIRNRVEDSEGPPDFWAEEYAGERYGPWPVAAFPQAGEQVPGPGGR